MGCQDRLSIIFQWTAISEYHTDTFVDVKVLHGYNIFIKLYADCILSNWPELNLVLSNLNLTSLVDSRLLYGPSESSKVDVELPPIKNLIVFFLILENINTGTFNVSANLFNILSYPSIVIEHNKQTYFCHFSDFCPGDIRDSHGTCLNLREECKFISYSSYATLRSLQDCWGCWYLPCLSKENEEGKEDIYSVRNMKIFYSPLFVTTGHCWHTTHNQICVSTV